VFVDASKIKSTVSEGRVRLEGEVEFPFQRQDAARAIERLKGVLSVTNSIVVNAKRVDAKQIESAIQGALARRAQREAKRIGIEVTGTVVKLTGTVDSWAEKAALDSVALFSPGVSKVDNQLKVDSFR
jgi:osmotically-inducible protein OsmY